MTKSHLQELVLCHMLIISKAYEQDQSRRLGGGRSALHFLFTVIL